MVIFLNACSTIEFKKNAKQEYNASIFIDSIKVYEKVEIGQKQVFNILGNETIYKSKISKELYFCTKKILNDGYEGYFSFWEINGNILNINEDTLPHSTDLISCYAFDYKNGERLLFVDFLNSNISSSRPISGLFILKLDKKLDIYKILLKSNHVDERLSNFGYNNGSLYYLQDDGGLQVNIYKYQNDSLLIDNTRHIFLKDSLGLRYVDWQRIDWNYLY
jgi:hypothetical protein